MADMTVSASAVRAMLPSQVVHGVAGGSFSLGDVVVFNTSEVWVKADADAAATAVGLIGICVACGTKRSDGAVVANDKVDIVVHGRVTGFTGLNGGTNYYLSATAGKVADSAGTVSRFLGHATDTATLYLNPIGVATSS